MDYENATSQDLGSPDLTIVAGLLQHDSVLLVADRRVIYGSCAMHDNHKKLFGGNGSVGIGVVGSTDIGEACVGQVALPVHADAADVAQLVKDFRAAFFDLVPEEERGRRGFDCLVAGLGYAGGAARPRLWTFSTGAGRAAPSTVGLACMGVAAPLALAFGGQLHRPDLSADAALGLGAFLVEATSRCYASVGGGLDYLVFDAAPDLVKQPQLGPAWQEESTARLDALFARWPDG